MDPGQRITERKAWRTPLSPGRTRFTARTLCSCLCLAILLPVLPRSLAAQEVNREPKIKAVYVCLLANYVQWPKAKLPKNAPVVIGVLGKDPVNKYVTTIAKKPRKPGARRIVVKLVTKVADARRCHIVFVGNQARPKLVSDVLRSTPGPVLFVGEDDRFIGQGGVINMVVKQNKVRLQVSRKNAKDRQLKLSSKLMSVSDTLD